MKNYNEIINGLESFNLISRDTTLKDSNIPQAKLNDSNYIVVGTDAYEAIKSKLEDNNIRNVLLLDPSRLPKDMNPKFNLTCKLGSDIESLKHYLLNTLQEHYGIVKSNEDSIWVKSVYEICMDCVQYVAINANTVRKHYDVWNTNVMDNLPKLNINAGVNPLFRTAKGHNAICILAGPSLDKQLSTLKVNENNHTIITCSTAVKALDAYGIKPDIVVVVDSSYSCYKHIEGVDLKDAILVCDPVVDINVINSFNYVLFSSNEHPIYTHLYPSIDNHHGLLTKGGSVASSIVDLAVSMSFDNIAIIGMDMAWTNDKDHTDYCVKESRKKKEDLEREIPIEVKNWDKSGTVLSTNLMLGYCKNVEDIARIHKHVNVIDCTEGGMLKKLKIGSFSQYCENHIGTKLDLNIEDTVDERLNLKQCLITLSTSTSKSLKKYITTALGNTDVESEVISWISDQLRLL